MNEPVSASALLGLKQDLRGVLGDQACPVVTSLIVQSLFGGRIFRYDEGLARSDFVNEIRLGFEFFRVDLTKTRMVYDRPGFATEECYRGILLENPDTQKKFSVAIDKLLEFWQETNSNVGSRFIL